VYVDSSESLETADFPHEYAQIFAQLHFLATAFVLKALRKHQHPPEVSCNALLLNKSGKMVLFALKVKIDKIASCELKFESSNVITHSLPVGSLFGPDVCAAITKLVS